MGKGKVNHAPQRESTEVLISLFQALSPLVENHQCLWRVANVTPDLRLPSQPQGVNDHWLVPNYTAWWQRHMCVNLPRVALDSGAAGIWTRDLLIASPAPYCYATKPHDTLKQDSK